MDKPQKTIKFWQGPVPAPQRATNRNPSSKDHLDAIRGMRASPNNRTYGQYYTDQKLSPAIRKRGNDYKNISYNDTSDERMFTDENFIKRSKDDRVSFPEQILSGVVYGNDKPQSQNFVQRHRVQQADNDQSLPKINMSPQKAAPGKWVGAKSSELSKVMDNHKRVMRNLDQVWGYPKQGNVSYNYLSDIGKDHDKTKLHQMSSQQISVRDMPPNIHIGAEYNTEYTDNYIKSNIESRNDNRSIEMEKGKAYNASLSYKQQNLHAGILATQKANQNQIRDIVRNTMTNARGKKESLGSIQSPNEPYSGTTGFTGADKKGPHKTSIESGLTYSNAQLRNNIFTHGLKGNLTPVADKNSNIFSNSAPRGNSKLKSVSRLDGITHSTMFDQINPKRKEKLSKVRPHQKIRANNVTEFVQQTVFYDQRAGNTTHFTHEPKKNTIKGEKNKAMKKILASQQKNEKKLQSKRGLLNQQEVNEYLSIQDYVRPPKKSNKHSTSTNKERPGDVMYAAPKKRMMEQYYAMQHNDQNFKKLMESQGLPDSTVDNMFKIRRNTTQNTIANMKKAQELRIQNIQIVENMNVSSTKKNQIPTITQDLERNDSELKRNLNRSSLSTHKQVSSQKKQILSLQQTLRKSNKAEAAFATNESIERKKQVKFQTKNSARNSKKQHKVRFKTDDAIEEKDHLFDKYVKKALEDEVASINSINKRKSDNNNMAQMSHMLFEIKSYGKLSDKLTPRMGHAKFVNPTHVGRVLRSREKSQRRRDYSEQQRMKMIQAERESQRRESEKDVGRHARTPQDDSRISTYSRAQSRQSSIPKGELALAKKKLIKKNYQPVLSEAKYSMKSRKTKFDGQSHRSNHSRYNQSFRSFGSRRLIAGSGFRGISPDVVERLTGDHNCGRSLCSSSHNPRFMKLAKISERKPFNTLKKNDSKKAKKSFRDRSASPIKQSSNTDGSIQAVNIDLLKKEMMEAGCDPIDFDAINNSNEPTPRVDNSPSRRNIQVKLDEDWAKSKIFEAVQEIHQLPKHQKNKKSQEIEDRILNIRSQDIFNEEESKYNYSILRKMTSNISMVDPYDKEQVKEMYKKAKRTVEVLSEILMLSTDELGETIEKDGPGLEQMLKAGANRGDSPPNNKRTSIILLDRSYSTLNSNNVVKILLRCVKLYLALSDVKQILLIILKSEDMYYEQQNGILKTVVEKYESQPTSRLTEEDEGSVIKVLQFFKKLSRRIATFQQDHRLYQQFKFRDQELQQTILKRAKKLGQFLMAQDAEQEHFKFPALDVYGQLDFINLSPEDPKKSKVNLSTTLQKEGGIESHQEIQIQDELLLKTQQSNRGEQKEESLQKEQNEQTLERRESEVQFQTKRLNSEEFPYEDESSNNNDITNRISMEKIVTKQSVSKYEPESSQMTFQMKQQTNEINTNTNQSQFTSTVTDARMFTKQATQSSVVDDLEPTPDIQDSEGIKKGHHVKSQDSNASIKIEQGIKMVETSSQEQIYQQSKSSFLIGEFKQEENKFNPNNTCANRKPLMEYTFNQGFAEEKNMGVRTVYRNKGLQSANPTDEKILISQGDGSVTQNTVPYIDNQSLSKGIQQEKINIHDHGSSQRTANQIIEPIDEEDLDQYGGASSNQMRYTVVQFGDQSIMNGGKSNTIRKPKTPDNTSFAIKRNKNQNQIFEEEEPSATTEVTEIRQKGHKYKKH